MSQPEQTETLLADAEALGLSFTRTWQFLRASKPATDQRRKEAFSHLRDLCSRARRAQEITSWIQAERFQLPLGVECLSIEHSLAEFDAVLKRPVAHPHELLEELIELHAEIQATIQSRRSLILQVETLRQELDLLTSEGEKLDHLELSLSRLEGKVYYGHDPDLEKLALLEQTMAKAKQDRARRPQPAEDLCSLARESLTKRRERLTVAENEKLQELLKGSDDPSQRRALWNTLRDVDNKGSKPLKPKKFKAPQGKRAVDPNILGAAWESMSLISQTPSQSTARTRALDELLRAVGKKGRSAEKSISSLNGRLETEQAVQDEST